MPVVSGLWDQGRVFAALTCNPEEQHTQAEALMLELFEAAQAVLVKQLDVVPTSIVYFCEKQPMLTINSFPLEFAIRSTKSKEWGNKDDQQEIIRKVLKRMRKVLKAWTEANRPTLAVGRLVWNSALSSCSPPARRWKKKLLRNNRATEGSGKQTFLSKFMLQESLLACSCLNSFVLNSY